jgi:argininosuccinate lyase
MHLSRLCEELVLWSTEEFSFIEIDDAYPPLFHYAAKEKPRYAELVRGKTGRVYGNLRRCLPL